MENGRVEAGDGPLDDQLLVDRPFRIVPAGLAPEEAHVTVGPEASVAEPDAAVVVLEGQRIGRGAARGHGAQLGRGALVGVDGEDPVAARLGAGELVLAGEVVEGPPQHARLEVGGDLRGPVARPAIHHQDLVAKALQGGDAVRQVALLVQSDDGCGEPRHGSVLSRATRSVVEWSLGSPATSVRPPKLATSSRSGTDSGVWSVPLTCRSGRRAASNPAA